MVYHFAVFGEIPKEEYHLFFNGISELKPKFYMLIEGTSLKGYKIVPKSLQKAMEMKNKGISTQASKNPPKTQNVFVQGSHYVDNVEKVVSEHLPDAKLVYKEILEFHPDRKEMFQAKNMDHFLVAVYKMN